MSLSIKELLGISYPVMPVVVIEDLKNAIPLAETLAQSGLKAIELTLRTPCAIQAIDDIKRAIPELIVGAGSVTLEHQVQSVIDAGADFAVSPGTHHQIVESAKMKGLPLLPGVMTPSDILIALQAGLEVVKLFPADKAGGVSYIQSLLGPFPDLKFCPTGGINQNNYQDYLELDNVLCVGGSWLAPTDLVAQQRWDDIGAITKSLLAQK